MRKFFKKISLFLCEILLEMNFKTAFSIFMAFVMLVSSLGATGYERHCGCTGKVLKSVFFKTKSDCCSHVKSQKTKSCCSVKKHKAQKRECSIKTKKCCDTKLTYNHYDGEATFDLQSENAEKQSTITATLAQYFSGIKAENLSNNKFLKLRFKFAGLAPPYFLSGREILSRIQSIRC